LIEKGCGFYVSDVLKSYQRYLIISGLFRSEGLQVRFLEPFSLFYYKNKSLYFEDVTVIYGFKKAALLSS